MVAFICNMLHKDDNKFQSKDKQGWFLDHKILQIIFPYNPSYPGG